MNFGKLVCKIKGHDVVVDIPFMLSLRKGEYFNAIKECRRCKKFIEYVSPIPEDDEGRRVGVLSLEEYENEMEKVRKRCDSNGNRRY